MKRIRQIILPLSLTLALCAPVGAEHTGPYLGAFIGGTALVPTQASDSQGSFRLKFDHALQGSAVAGWDFETGNPYGEGRIEVEYLRRSNSLSRIRFTEGEVKGSGRLTTDGLLMNFYGVLRDDSPWAPYGVLGIGAARMDADLKATGQPLASGTSYVLAYQLGAGLDLALTDRISLDFGYRFFGSTRPTFTESTGPDLKMDYMTHSAVLGVRVGF